MLKRTHRLIMIQFQNSTPSYDAKIDYSNDLSSRKLRLKRTTFVNFQPLYDSQVGHFMGKVTWKKLTDAQANFPIWVGAIAGQLGQ
jgi:hypothetical protein